MRARTGRLRRLISSKPPRASVPASGERGGKQLPLRKRLAHGAFDVAGGEFAAALELLVEAFQHAARLLGGVARALDGDVVAALLGGHGEPPLDQAEVLAVLAEQRRGEAVVVEREHDLVALGPARGRDQRIGDGRYGAQTLSGPRGCCWPRLSTWGRTLCDASPGRP